MLLTKTLFALVVNLAVANAGGGGGGHHEPEPPKCGTADACVGTATCKTTTIPATTTTLCVPTPTCIGVYGDCETGGGSSGKCCSGVCAATKCRPTDEKWPGCSEDFGLCKVDDDCCYSHRLSCVGGLCREKKKM